MTKADDGYRLVLFDPPDDPKEVRDLLARVTGAHPTDVMQWVARSPGIWNRSLTQGQARDLLDGLFDLGLAAEARRPDLIPNLSPPRTIHSAACLDAGLRIEGLRGEPTHWVPWDKVELVVAGRIAAEDEFRDIVPPSWVSSLSTGLNALLRRPQMVARRQRSIRIPRDPVGEAIVVRKDPRIAFRFVENAMNYASMGELLRPSAAENFPLFLRQICERACEAFVTPTAHAVIGREIQDERIVFPSSQALLEEATLRLLWSWYRRDRDEEERTQE